MNQVTVFFGQDVISIGLRTGRHLSHRLTKISQAPCTQYRRRLPKCPSLASTVGVPRCLTKASIYLTLGDTPASSTYSKGGAHKRRGYVCYN